MSIIIKTDDQIELMRQSGHLLAKVHEELHQMIHPGMATMEIDTIGEKLIRQMGGIPNFKNYEGYPASICVSVNDEVVHGIPHPDHILQEGDIVYVPRSGIATVGFWLSQVNPFAMMLSIQSLAASAGGE